MVRVNNDLADTKEGETKVNIKYKDKEVETKSIKSKLGPASLIITLMPMVKIESGESETGNKCKYSLEIKNSTNEKQKNIKVTINKNDLLDIKSIGYVSGDEYKINEGNDLTFDIESIEPKGIVYVIMGKL